MARTNIEEEAHRRVAKLAQLMKCSDREALGTVGYLWTDSQDILQTSGTREQILEWAHLFNISDQEANEWISALEKSRFISCLENGHYKIHGNEIQIEARVRHTARAVKGGNALKKKWNAKKKLKAGLKPATSSPKADDKPATSSPMQCNSMQGNSMQGNSKVPAEPSRGDAAKNFIAAYCERFKARWGTNPPIQDKDAGIAKRVAKGLSTEKRDLYLDAYFSMPDAWVVKAKHPINLFETKLNEISVFAQSGQFHTQRQVREADSSATNALLLAKIDKGEL